MPNPSTTEQLERDAKRIPVTDQQHQPDQSLHQQEINRAKLQQRTGNQNNKS